MSEINNPEVPEQISARSSMRVDARIESAAFIVARQISTLGDYEFYRKSWGRLPKPLTRSIRHLTDSYFPPRGDGEDIRTHPFSYAAERGLVVGMVLADNALKSNTSFATFSKRMTGEFTSLRSTLQDSPYDLADVLERTGETFAGNLREKVDPPHLTELDIYDDSPIELRRQALYANAVGYVGVAVMNKLVEQEIKKIQPKDRQAEWAIRSDLGFLDDPNEILTTAHFDINGQG